MIPQSAEVVVIGSGPSGSMAAGLLAKQGIDVVLLDRESHPRLRVGESLIPQFWRFADLLGATPAIEAANFVQKQGAVASWHDQLNNLTFAKHGYRRPAMHVDRDAFDLILVQQAQSLGAKLYEGVTVKGVDFSPTAQTVRYQSESGEGSLSARYMVDATGQNALLGRQLGVREFDPAFRFMSIWSYFKNSSYMAADRKTCPFEQRYAKPPVTFLTSLPQCDHMGWSWHIVLRETTSVGFVVPQPMMKTLRQQFDDWTSAFLHLVDTTPILKSLLADAVLEPDKLFIINDYSAQSSRVSGDGFFLVGDAAGFVDPVFSNGVTIGMYAGSLAAATIEQCLMKPERAAYYQSLYNHQLSNQLYLARCMALPGHEDAPFDEDRARTLSQFMSRGAYSLTQEAAALSERSAQVRRLLST